MGFLTHLHESKEDRGVIQASDLLGNFYRPSIPSEPLHPHLTRVALSFLVWLWGETRIHEFWFHSDYVATALSGFCYQQDEIGVVPEEWRWRWRSQGVRGCFQYAIHYESHSLGCVNRRGWVANQIVKASPQCYTTPERKFTPSTPSVTPRPSNLSIAQDV